MASAEAPELGRGDTVVLTKVPPNALWLLPMLGEAAEVGALRHNPNLDACQLLFVGFRDPVWVPVPCVVAVPEVAPAQGEASGANNLHVLSEMQKSHSGAGDAGEDRGGQ